MENKEKFEIKLDHSSNEFAEQRKATVMFNGNTYLTENPNNCEISYNLEFNPDTKETTGILTYCSAVNCTSYKAEDWKNAPVAWAFVVQAIQNDPMVSRSKIRNYFKGFEDGNTLKPF